MSHYESVPVVVPRIEKKWWEKHRKYPVFLHLDFENLRVKIGSRDYLLREIGNGEYMVTTKFEGKEIEVGRFGKHRVYRTISNDAFRDCKAIRAAVINDDYRFVCAVKDGDDLYHPGPCAVGIQGVNLYTVKDKETRCETCGEGFE